MNGVTYTNVCKCREAKVDVGYWGPCNADAKIEWVKKPDTETVKNMKYYKPKEEEKKKDDLISLKWSDYSWEYPGWNDQTLHGYQEMGQARKAVNMERPELNNLKYENLKINQGNSALNQK